MSEQAAVPFFGDGPAEVASPHEAARPAVGDRGRDWPLATVILGGVAASYAVVIWAIYAALTALFQPRERRRYAEVPGVNVWLYLAAAAAVIVLLNVILVLVLVVRSRGLENENESRR